MLPPLRNVDEVTLGPTALVAQWPLPPNDQTLTVRQEIAALRDSDRSYVCYGSFGTFSGDAARRLMSALPSTATKPLPHKNRPNVPARDVGPPTLPGALSDDFSSLG